MVRSCLDRLQDIRRAVEDIRLFVTGIDREVFLATPSSDRKTFPAVSACLIEIGEAVKGLPEELTARRAEIPWRSIAGMRDRVAHEYFQIDPEILWDTIESGDLDALMRVVEEEIDRMAGK